MVATAIHGCDDWWYERLVPPARQIHQRSALDLVRPVRPRIRSLPELVALSACRPPGTRPRGQCTRGARVGANAGHVAKNATGTSYCAARDRVSGTACPAAQLDASGSYAR